MYTSIQKQYEGQAGPPRRGAPRPPRLRKGDGKMGMYETARSLKMQEQQRRAMAKQGTWPDANNDPVVRKIKSLMRGGKKN